MKHFVNISYAESVTFNRLLLDYKDLLTRIHLDIQEFTCRYSFKTTKLIIQCTVNTVNPTMKFTVHAYEENYAMLTRKAIPPFDVVFTFTEGHATIIKQPNNKDVVKWLYTMTDTSKRMVKDELGYIVLHCLFALNGINPLFIKKQNGDTIEYSFPPNFTKIAKEYLNNARMENRKNTLLDGWDVVNLTEKQFYKVIDVNQKQNVEYDDVNIPLPKFCLAIFDGKTTDYYFYEKHGNTVKCGVTDPSNYVTKFFDVIIQGKTPNGVASTLHVDDKDTDLWEWLNEPIAKDGSTNWEWCADAFFIINTFMLNVGDVAMEVETKEAVGPSEKKEYKRRERNSVRLFKSYRLVKNWTTKARKKAEITCLAWGVRGHFRHLRNGKTVFVEAYVKGKERDKYKGKEYNLMPYKDA